MKLMLYDHSLAEYQRLAGEMSDSPRIERAVADCERGVLFLPKGVYELDRMLTIKNC